MDQVYKRQRHVYDLTRKYFLLGRDVLIAELQRLSSHLVWFGTHAMEIGAITGMLYAFREREILMNLNELLAGFRFFPSYIRVGGLREDIPRGYKEAVTAFLDRFPGKLDEYETLITKNPIWLDRTRGVGVITLPDCYKWGLYGPIARAAGGTVSGSDGGGTSTCACSVCSGSRPANGTCPVSNSYRTTPRE